MTIKLASPFEVSNTASQFFGLGLPAPARIVFNPAATRQEEVYTSWSEITASMSSFNSPVEVYVPANANLTVGSYTMPTTWYLTIGAGVTLTLDDGANLSTFPALIRGERGHGDTPAILETNAVTTSNFTISSVASIIDGVELVAHNSAVMISVTGVGTATFVLENEASFTIDVNAIIQSSAVVTVYSFGSTIQGSTIATAGAIHLKYDASSTVDLGQGGTVTPTLLTQSSIVGYTPSVPSNWLTPPTEVAQALDELSSLTSFSSGAISVIYQPGGTPVGNSIFTSWTALTTYLSPFSNYSATIYFDGQFVGYPNIVIDGGATTVPANTTFIGLAPVQSALTTILPTVTIADGSVIGNLTWLTVSRMTLASNAQSTASMFFNGVGGPPALRLTLLDVAQLTNTTAATFPFIELTGSYPLISQMYGNSSIVNNATAQPGIIKFDDTTSSAMFMMYDSSSVGDNTFLYGGGVGPTLTFDLLSPAATVGGNAEVGGNPYIVESIGSNIVTFRTGGPVAPNVFDNWTILLSAIAQNQGETTIYVDFTAGSTAIPAAVYPSPPALKFVNVSNPISAPINFANVQFSGCIKLTVVDFIAAGSGGTRSTLDGTGFSSLTFRLLGNSTLTGSGGQPFFNAVANDYLVELEDTSQFAGTNIIATDGASQGKIVFGPFTKAAAGSINVTDTVDLSVIQESSGTGTFTNGVSTAIPVYLGANGITNSIVITPKDPLTSTAVGTPFVKTADRTLGTPGSFKVTSIIPGTPGTTQTSDQSSFDWHISSK